MYARLVLFTMENGNRAVAEQMADRFHTAMQQLDGFQGATFFVNEETKQYGAVSLWATEAAGAAAGDAMSAGLHQALQGLSSAPPVQQMFEVYVPAAIG